MTLKTPRDPLRDHCLKTNTWITNDGRWIRLRDMEQSHLENVLVWIDSQLQKDPVYQPRWWATWVKRVNLELNRRQAA